MLFAKPSVGHSALCVANLPGVTRCRSGPANCSGCSEVYDHAAAGAGVSERVPVPQQVMGIPTPQFEPAHHAGLSQCLYILQTSMALARNRQAVLQRRYLSVQSVVWPQTGAAAATAAIGPLVNWLLVFKFGFGLDGAAAATVLLYAVETLLLLGIVIARDKRLAGTEQQTWHGWCVSLSANHHRIAQVPWAVGSSNSLCHSAPTPNSNEALVSFADRL